MADGKKLRSRRGSLGQELLPNGNYGYGHKDSFGPAEDRRRSAIKRVLTTLPDKYFAPFKAAMNDGNWFVPKKGLWGKAAVILSKKVTIYIPAILEFAGELVVESVVAHEVLHVALGHKLKDCTKEEDEQQEQQVGRILEELGYVDTKAELTMVFEKFPAE